MIRLDTKSTAPTVMIIGGVVFYSEIITRRTDVICSVMTGCVYFRTGCSGPSISITKNPNNMIKHVEASHNVVINVNKISSQCQEY